MAEQERASDERRVGQDRVRRLGRMRRHHGVVLGQSRAYEDVLDVMGERLRALQSGALGEDFVEVSTVVEVDFGWQPKMLGAGFLDDSGEPGPREETYAISSLDEMTCDREQRRDMPVDRHGRDQDRRHDVPPVGPDEAR